MNDSSPQQMTKVPVAIGQWFSRPTFILFLTAVLTYGYFPPTAGWNENSRFNLTRAIVDQGSVFIDAYHLNTADKSYCQGTHFCCDKAPGTSFLGVIPYAVYRTYLDLIGASPPAAKVIFRSKARAAKRQLSAQDTVRVNTSFMTSLYVVTLFSSVIAGAFSVVMVVWLCRLFGGSLGISLWIAALYGFGTIAFPYSTALFGHQPASALFLAAFVLVEKWLRLGPSDQETKSDGSARYLIAAGFLAGFSVLTEYPLALPVLGLGCYLALRTKGSFLQRLKPVRWYVLGGLPMFCLLCLYLWAAFGSPLALGYGQLADPTFAKGQSQGLYGLTFPRWNALWGTLFGRFRGLFYISPVLLLSFVGWVVLWRQRIERPLLWFSASMVVYFTLLNASYYMWWGGASAGPRHLVPMLPFMVLPLVAFASLRSPWRIGAIVLGSVSTANVFALTMVGIKPPEFGDILFYYAWPTLLRLNERNLHPNLGTLLGVPEQWSLIAIVLLWLISAVLIVQRVRDLKTESVTKP